MRALFDDFVKTLDFEKLRRQVCQTEGFKGLLFSKDDKEPPKGFEKFFRKRNDRKQAATKDTESDKEEEGAEKKGKLTHLFEAIRLKFFVFFLGYR